MSLRFDRFSATVPSARRSFADAIPLANYMVVAVIERVQFYDLMTVVGSRYLTIPLKRMKVKRLGKVHYPRSPCVRQVVLLQTRLYTHAFLNYRFTIPVYIVINFFPELNWIQPTIPVVALPLRTCDEYDPINRNGIHLYLLLLAPESNWNQNRQSLFRSVRTTN